MVPTIVPVVLGAHRAAQERTPMATVLAEAVLPDAILRKRVSVLRNIATSALQAHTVLEELLRVLRVRLVSSNTLSI